jgi:hypothetical protein
VANLKGAEIAHVVVSRSCRIKTLKWARGFASGASVPGVRRRVYVFGRMLAVTTRGEDLFRWQDWQASEGEKARRAKALARVNNTCWQHGCSAGARL